MGSSGSEHEDESAEWRRSARCRSANANILGASFALSIRGRLRLASDGRLHSLLSRAAYLSFARQSPSQTSRGAAESKLFGLCPTGQSHDQFQSRLRDHKKTLVKSSICIPRPCCGRWWTAMGGRKTCVERRFPKRSVALESITRAAGIPHLQELSVLL